MDDSVSIVNGKLFLRHIITDPPSVANDVRVQERLLKILEEQAGEVFSPVKVQSNRYQVLVVLMLIRYKLLTCTL